MKALEHQTGRPEKSQNFFGRRNFLKINYYGDKKNENAKDSQVVDD